MMTKKATASKHDALLESVDAGQPIRSMGCVEPELSDNCLWAEKRAKLKAHLKPLLSDPETWDIIVRRGLA